MTDPTYVAPTPLATSTVTGVSFGKVVGRIFYPTTDNSTTADADALPDWLPANQHQVVFTPDVSMLKATNALVINDPVVCNIDAQGYVMDRDSTTVRGVWLIPGIYMVEVPTEESIEPFYIEVKTTHTDTAPLDLATEAPYTNGTMTQYMPANLRDTGWKDMTATIVGTKATSGTLFMRRIGSTVHCRFANLTAAADSTGSVTFSAIPTGYKPYYSNSLFVRIANSAVTTYLIWADGTSLAVIARVFATYAAGWRIAEPLTGIVSWYTEDAFPA